MIQSYTKNMKQKTHGEMSKYNIRLTLKLHTQRQNCNELKLKPRALAFT